jgi:outer membrane protein TolC
MMREFNLFHLSRSLILLFVMAYCLPVFAITIQEAFISAIKFDPALRASRFNQDATSENIAIARSRLLPQISLQGASNQLTQTTTQDSPGNSSVSRSFSGPSVNHQFAIRQGLLRPKDIASLNFSKLQAQYSQVKYESDLSDLWMRVFNNWIELVGTAQLVEAYEQPLSKLLDTAKQENAKLIQGDGTKDAVSEAEAQYQFSKALHLQALQTLYSKQRAFEMLTHLDSNSLLLQRLSLNPKPTFSLDDRDQIWLNFKNKSFEVKFSRLQEMIQSQRVLMAKADNLPTLDVLATWSLGKNDATSTQGFQYKNNQLGIQYSVPIYAGGSISAAERQAALNLEASIADGEAVANRLEGEFHTLWGAWIGQSARVEGGYKLLESSKLQVRAVTQSYIHGVKTILDLANAELALSRRTADQINSVMELIKFTVRLSKNQLQFNN